MRLHDAPITHFAIRTSTYAFYTGSTLFYGSFGSRPHLSMLATDVRALYLDDRLQPFSINNALRRTSYLSELTESRLTIQETNICRVADLTTEFDSDVRKLRRSVKERPLSYTMLRQPCVDHDLVACIQRQVARVSA